MSQAVSAVSTPALCAADLNTTINCEPRIMDLRLAEALGFEHPRRIRSLIDRHGDALRRFGEVCTTTVQTSGKGGRPGKASWLTKKQALYISTKSETDHATDITIQIVEVFDAVTSGAAIPVRAHERKPAVRKVPGAVSKTALDTYATWLHFERVAVLAELYPDVPPGHRFGVGVNNPGAFYHRAAADEVLAPPSTRAVQVLRAVGCPVPKPRKPITG